MRGRCCAVGVIAILLPLGCVRWVLGQATNQTPVGIPGITGAYGDPFFNVRAFGALGNTQSVRNAAVSAGTLNQITAQTGTAPFSTGDVGKSLSIDESIAPGPTLAGITATATGCHSPGITGPTAVYYRYTYYSSSSGEGSPSLEGVVAVKSGATDCVFITTPASRTGFGSYKVYAAIDATGAAPGSASGTEIFQNTSGTACGNGTQTITMSCELDSIQTTAQYSASVSSYSRSTGVATITTASASPYFFVNQWVRVSGVAPDISFNGVWKVTGATTSPCCTITFSQHNLAGSSGTSSGTVVGSVPPGPSVLLAQITGVSGCSTGCTTVTINNSLPAAVPANTVSWGNNDTSAIGKTITACLNNVASGCTVFFPPGSYWVQGVAGQGSALSVPTNQPFVRFMGAGASSALELGAGTATNSAAAASEIVTADQTYILGVGAAGTPSDGGPRISDLSFRDVSGPGNALGAIHFGAIAHTYLDHVGLVNFTNGIGAYFDAASTSPTSQKFNQYNFMVDTTAINVRTPFQFSTGENSSNWIIGGNLVSSTGRAELASISRPTRAPQAQRQVDITTSSTLNATISQSPFTSSIRTQTPCFSMLRTLPMPPLN